MMAGVLAGLVCAAPLLGLLTSAAVAQNQPGLDCNLFGPRHPCSPYLLTSPGQDLRLTISSRRPHGLHRGADMSGSRIDTIRQLFAVLRRCWSPPAREQGRRGMELSVRLSFDRFGALIGEPRLTYSSRAASMQQRQRYKRAVADSLLRCTPLPFTAGMGGAIAGRPLMIRYIDDRNIHNTGA